MKLRCIAIDDEPLALKQIQSYIGKTDFLSLQGSFPNALEAFDKVNETRPDLLFVDINMPELNGIDFVKMLDYPVMIIFTTAYDEYAVEGFKLDAIDYLLKPISYAGFLKAANKARELFELKRNAKETVSVDNNYLFVKSDYRVVRIRYEDIKYVVSQREYVQMFLSDGSSVITLLSMKSVEERLPKDIFMRVHRSYIVNVNKITVIERQRIVFDKKIYIPIGDLYKENFDNYVKKHFL
ncbi:MAG: LytTR family DNA-binding domain-containing protein [Bacteroidales bacterium]|jgi:DNA-binding LytR/AlgR family response regulator|nr:LytTR family DNA-binding domain-containing protein [Bacteroidales bacterium]